MRKVFTTGQAAELCKVAPRTVSKWFDSGRLRGYRIPPSVANAQRFGGGGDRRIPREQLIAFMKEHGFPLGELEAEQWHKILLVGTDVIFVDLLTQVLPQGHYFKYELAQSGFEAGIMAESYHPDTILIDMALGRTESIQISQNLRKYPAYEKTLIVGLANEDEAEPAKLTEFGFSAVFKKPVDQLEISKVIIAYRDELDGVVPEYGKGQTKRVRTRKPATTVGVEQ